MNSQEIQSVLLRSRFRRNLLMPRWTPAQWFECDLFELTAAGFWREYEIKVSRSDFRNDRRKGPTERDLKWWKYIGAADQETRSKHDRLAAGDTRGPVQFWFVAPAGIIPLEELPHWAGLIEIHAHRTGRGLMAHERSVKSAPRLHRQPLKDPQSVERQLQKASYYRLLGRELWNPLIEVQDHWCI